MEFERNYNLINSKFWEFFFPTLFTSMAGNVCLFVDTVLISFFLGSISLSAIQAISPLTTFVNLLYWMVGLGGSIICVAAKAKFENEKSNELFSVSIISITIIGIIITVLSSIFSNGIIHFLSHSSFDSLAATYFNLYILGLPFLCYMMSLTYFVRADGLSNLPFKALLLSNTINLLFDVIFMKFLNLGISGAALALIIGYIAGSLMMSTYFFNSKRTLKLVKVKIISFLRYFVEICKSGFSGASNFLYSTIIVFAYNYLILYFIGYDGLSALNVCSNTLFITSIFIIGTIQTISPLLSLYYKSGEYSSVSYLTRKAFRILLICLLFFTILNLIWPDLVLMIYSMKASSNFDIYFIIRVYSLRYLGIALVYLYIYHTQALQLDKLANIISFFAFLISPIISAFSLAYLFGVNGIWISYPVTDLITLLFAFACNRYVIKRSDGEYHGFFINKSNDINYHEFTVNANYDDVKEFTSYIQKNFREYELANILSLTIEDFLLKTIEINNELKTIDISFQLDDDAVIFIKDLGIESDETLISQKESIGDVEYKRDINHSRVLGLNSTEILITESCD